ncbi:hypothetical protein HG535_0C03480 [Zygotorulaspora mrakii]|uniref:Swi5-domain-containing protein n=1 Tax=Zygotorulaspora mrakii TaxID=42260 RepID=A0A7H9AZW7_ZYGMR|nr:uncharacterized protein HG535_0C03480 [Zygotorulaspora mrakii]QLG71995.1 hypothetical protein HG535_0C03480 [Zygotorulaspora mrakii]
MDSKITNQINEKQREQFELKRLNQTLREELNSLTAERFSANNLQSPQQIYKSHIKRLKEYNELRDTGLRLVQMIADEKSCTLKDVFDEMGQEMGD